MRRPRSILTVVAVIAVMFAAWLCRGGEALAPGVTRASIRAIRVGMTEADVISILGEPLGRSSASYAGLQTLEYSRPVRQVRWYPMLWVYLKGGKVVEVYAKRYVLWGLDDEGVYSLSTDGASETKDFGSTFTR